jgi:exonuclease VII large subunit
MVGWKLSLKGINRLWKELSSGAIEVLLRQKLETFKLNGKSIAENLTLSQSGIFRRKFEEKKRKAQSDTIFGNRRSKGCSV